MPRIAGRNWDFHTRKLCDSKRIGIVWLNWTRGLVERRREEEFEDDDWGIAEDGEVAEDAMEGSDTKLKQRNKVKLRKFKREREKWEREVVKPDNSINDSINYTDVLYIKASVNI